MPFYEGETLRERLGRGPLAAEQALRVLEKVVAALEAAHAAGVAHRGIKPGNVMITSDGEIKLLDFALASDAEQLRFERTDAGVDLWAVGVLAHEMLFGEDPFAGRTRRLTFEPRDTAQVGADPAAASLTHRLERVATRLLATLPTDRYQSASELAQALSALRGVPRTPVPGTHTGEASLARLDEGWTGAVRSAPEAGVPPEGAGTSAKGLSWRPPVISLEPGTVIGRYVIVQALGRGGMGAVMLAYDTQLARRVAIKVLLTNVASEEARLRMLREAQAMAQLSHPNVVDVYDVGTHQGNIFLAMRYVEGVTLQQWLGTRRSPREALKVMKQAGRGLAAAHAAGIVHRDFKPENVLVTKAGHAYVLDFGIARSEGVSGSAPRDPSVYAEGSGAHALLPRPSSDGPRDPLADSAGRLTQTGTILGTVGYFAPETTDRGIRSQTAPAG
jgi:serine/threonine protein kinase